MYYDDEEYEDYLEEQSARDELDNIYALLKKNVNKEIKTELENLREQNQVFIKQIAELSEELNKFKCEEYNIRNELEREYKEKERNLYKRPISEVANLINKTYYSVESYFDYPNCEYCNNTGKISIVDVFNRTHKVECKCRNNSIRKYKVVEQYIGFIKTISIRNNNLAVWVIFDEIGVNKDRGEYGYLSGRYFDTSYVIDSEEKLQKFIDKFDRERTYYCDYKFTTKELAKSFINYLYSIEEVLEDE